MQAVYNVLDWIDSNILWGIPMIILILLAGILLTVKSKALQVRKFNLSMSQTMGKTIKGMKKGKKKKSDNSLSPFSAFCTAVSGTVGTGNIVGVTTAIISGGPGAVFWMWVSAFFGCVTKYSEITLGMAYRRKDYKGEYLGGPMYYIENGVRKKWLAVMFAVFTMLAAVGYGSVQSNTIQATWKAAFEIPTWVTAIIVAFFTALVVLGGLKRIGRVTTVMVPFMAIAFIIMALILIFANVAAIPAAFASIFTSAFTAKSALGGFMGYGIAQAMRYGFARGIFSNEAGLGSSSMVHTTSDCREPVEQGLWGIFEVFLDTFIICTLTALFVLTSGLTVTEKSDGATVAMNAFTGLFGTFGTIAYSIILPLFAFSTVLAWAVYGAKATQYIFKNHQKASKIIYNILYIALIIIVGLITYFAGDDNLGSKFVWLFSDMTNALMAIPNLIALVILSKQVVAITKNYFDRKKGLPVKPMLSAYEEENDFLIEQQKAAKELENANS